MLERKSPRGSGCTMRPSYSSTQGDPSKNANGSPCPLPLLLRVACQQLLAVLRANQPSSSGTPTLVASHLPSPFPSPASTNVPTHLRACTRSHDSLECQPPSHLSSRLLLSLPISLCSDVSRQSGEGRNCHSSTTCPRPTLVLMLC